MPKRLLAALLLAGLLAVLAGCGSGSGDDTTAAADGGASTETTSPGTQPESTSPEPAAQGTIPTGNGEGGIELTEVGSFSEPVWLTQAPGGEELYVVEQSGAVRVIGADGETLPEPFLDVSADIVSGGEQGLLSLAFSPDYEQSGLFYVDYTDTEGDTRIVEYQRSGDDPLVADPASKRVVLSQDQPYANHNGGLVIFGPDDRLYIGFGDGGSAGDPERNAQNPDTFLGKILRMDPAGGEPEILTLGMRNPWRFSFDRETGGLWIGDVGQDSQEEIDFLPGGAKGSGANFGWSAFEGTDRFNEDEQAPNAIEPVLTYGRDGGCSVTGGYVVRDPKLTSLYGRYLYGDFCEGQLRSFTATANGAGDDRELGVQVSSLSSFAEDASGRVYALSIEGPVYRLDPAK